MAKHFVLVACTFAFVAGCKSGTDAPPPAPTEIAAAAEAAVAPPTAANSLPKTMDIRAVFVKVKSLPGHSVSGEVTFTKTGDGLSILADLEGLTPGLHGFHIHEIGDCSAEDFSSAGGHFNPGGMDHGAPGAASHHAGDLGNLEVGDDGKVRRNSISNGITLSAGENSIMGRSVVIHADADDLTTQPTGASGARVACGVIDPEEGH